MREPASAEELARCQGMYSRTLSGPWISDTKRLDKDTVLVGAWLGEVLAGIGCLNFHSKVEGQIRWMHVEEEYRSQGVGTALLAELERTVASRGARTVILRTREATLGFYIMRGYDIRNPPRVLFDSVPRWDLRKALDSGDLPVLSGE